MEDIELWATLSLNLIGAIGRRDPPAVHSVFSPATKPNCVGTTWPTHEMNILLSDASLPICSITSPIGAGYCFDTIVLVITFLLSHKQKYTYWHGLLCTWPGHLHIPSLHHVHSGWHGTPLTPGGHTMNSQAMSGGASGEKSRRSSLVKMLVGPP